jgi:hypothetical protein
MDVSSLGIGPIVREQKKDSILESLDQRTEALEALVGEENVEHVEAQLNVVAELRAAHEHLQSLGSWLSFAAGAPFVLKPLQKRKRDEDDNGEEQRPRHRQYNGNSDKGGRGRGRGGHRGHDGGRGRGRGAGRGMVR